MRYSICFSPAFPELGDMAALDRVWLAVYSSTTRLPGTPLIDYVSRSRLAGKDRGLLDYNSSALWLRLGFSPIELGFCGFEGFRPTGN